MIRKQAQTVPEKPELPEETETTNRDGWKWWISIILFLATVLTYLDRQTISLCGSMIAKDFHLNNEQFGQLLAAFRWAYAITHILAGYLADHFNTRIIFALAVGVWSLAGATAAAVRNVFQMLVTRSLLGIGEAFNWPCATRITANMMTSKDRGLGSGIFNSGAAVGSLIAPLIIVPIAIKWGWRAAFFVIGFIGVFWIILWLVATRKNTRANALLRGVSSEDGDDSKMVEPKGRKLSFRKWAAEVLLHPAFWMLVVVSVTINPCWYFLNEWIPKYMHDQQSLGYLLAGMVTVPIFLGADLGNLFSGGLIKWLASKGWSVRKARGFTLLLAALLILPVMLIKYTQHIYIIVALLGLAGLGITSFVANYTACQQDFSFGNVGIVAGILGMSSNVFAATINPLIGRYIDQSGNYNLIFTLVAVLPILSLLAILNFDRIINPQKDKRF
jgi:ACS family hexuronate transporter-like MFS transporter